MILAVPVAGAGLLSAVGWGLLQFLWQGSLVAVALAAALNISRKGPAKLRYAMCCAALGAMVLCPVFTSVSLAVKGSSQRTMEEAGASITASGGFQAVEQLQIKHDYGSFIDWTDRHITAMLMVWLVGVLLVSARVLVSIAAARRLKAASVHAAPEGLCSLASRLSSRMGISLPVRLLVSGEVTAPVVVGWRKPAILVPSSSLRGLSPQQANAILAHELAHIRRRDYLVNVLQAAVEAVLFYHPALWWVSRRIRREREHCCDDLALRIGGSALAYAKALAMLEERRFPAKPDFSLALHGGDLSMRIKRLLERTQTESSARGTRVYLASLGAFTLVLLVLLSISATDSVRAQTAQSATERQPVTLRATNRSERPDMSCTYYDNRGQDHAGSCEVPPRNSGAFYCRQTDGTKLRQIQTSCEWKVQRLREWERQQSRGRK